MKFSMGDVQPRTTYDKGHRAPVVLHLRSLTIRMTTTEAIHLADILVDATEKETSHEA